MSKFQLHVALRESYLAGSIYEFDPTLSVYAAWTGGRYSRTAQLVPNEWHDLGLYDLPNALESNKEDEVMSFTAFAQTRTSGIAPIDEKESRIVQRMIPTGVEKVDLRDLLAASASRDSADQDLILTSPMVLRDAREHALAGRAVSDLADAERDELSREITLLSTKLWLKVRIILHDRRAVDAWLQHKRPTLQKRLLYFDERTVAAISESLSILETSYVTHLTEIELPPAALRGEAATRIPWNPHEPISKDLHFFSGDTPAGPLPPIAWTFQDVQTRIGASALAGEDAVTAKETAQFLESSLLGSLWAAGMDGATFTHVVAQQCAVSRKHDSQMMSSFRTAVGAVLSVATLVANQALYATDMEYPNVHALQAMTREKQSLYAPGLVKAGLIQQLGSPLRAPLPPRYNAHERVWANAGVESRLSSSANPTQMRYCHKCHKLHSRKRSYIGVTAESAAKASFEATVVVTGDRWDTTINSQDTTTADCEEGGFGITANLDAMEVFLEKFLEKNQGPTATANARPILVAAHQVLQRLTFLANGASSTEPYVAAGAPRGSSATHMPLPVIGSAEDQKWAENGHGFATVQTKASWAEAVLRGIHVLPLKDAREHEQLTERLHREVDAAESWLAQLRPFVLEGTGPTTMEMLSVEEIYAGTDRAEVYVRKVAAKIALLRRIRRMDKDDTVAAAFADVVKHESLPYEVWAPVDPALRRSHPFYRTIMHCVGPKAVRMYGGIMGQVAAINLAGPSGTGPVRAVTIGDYGRMARNVALVPVYAADVTFREWNEKIQPAIDCLTNLQQASTWARSPQQFPPKTAQLVTRSAFTQLAANAASLTHVDTALNALPTVHSSLPSSEADALALVVGADASDAHVTFQMFLPAWQVAASAQKLQGLMEAVDALKQEGVVAAALIVREQPLWRCAATLRLILVLNVAKELDLNMWPRPTA